MLIVTEDWKEEDDPGANSADTSGRKTFRIVFGCLVMAAFVWVFDWTIGGVFGFVAGVFFVWTWMTKSDAYEGWLSTLFFVVFFFVVTGRDDLKDWLVQKTEKVKQEALREQEQEAPRE